MTSSDPSLDSEVAIVGSGPAGWALSAALRDVGVAATVVAPDPYGTWAATYAMWADELPDWVAKRSADPDALFGHRWNRVRVAGHQTRELERVYARLDNSRLRQALSAGGAAVEATVRGATHFGWGSRLHTDVGDVTARIVVDASGAAGVLGSPRRNGTQAAQVAYGLVVPSAALPDPWRPPGGCTLMDWRPVHSTCPTALDSTFLYVLDDGDHALVEETSLVRRPPLRPDELRYRLACRLGSDLTDAAVDVEVVHIPMHYGISGYQRGDSVVKFGAAAGYVHPATGYSVTASVRCAPRVAQAIAAELRRDVPQISEIAAAVWPTPQRRVRALHDVGLAALERLDPDDIRTFFDAFFDLPADQWSAYLRVDASPGQISRAMSGVFRRLSWRQRRDVMLARPQGLLRAVFAGGS